MDFKRAAVVGSGQMGGGIAHVLAASGMSVVLIDVKKEFLDRALAAIRGNMERQADKGVLARSDMEAALKRIRTSLKPEDAGEAQVAIEAVTEDLDLKKGIFSRLDAACPPEAMLATNTSSLSVTAMAAATKRPSRVVGMHFMNPVPVMKLVEIVPGLETSEETLQAAKALAVKLGKEPVVSKDFPGFISNRVLMPMINEACYALMEGVAAKEDIDKVMRLGMNHPMGPLALADFIGIDTCLYIMETLHRGFGDSKYRPCPLLRKMAEAGRLGRKAGRGFYEYG